MRDQRLAHHRSAAHREIEDTRRQAGARQDLRDRPGAAGRQVGGLADDGVAVRECRRDLPRRNRDRKIPRRDEPDDPQRLARDLDFDAGADRRKLLAGHADDLAREEPEDLARARRLADALRQRLAFLARQQGAQLVLARQDLGARLVEDVCALLNPPGRPRRKRLLRRRDRVLRLREVGLRVFADHVARIRGIAIDGDRRAGDPFAADVVPELFGHFEVLFAIQMTPRRARLAISAPAPGGTGGHLCLRR